jgi:hypothetical protein
VLIGSGTKEFTMLTAAPTVSVTVTRSIAAGGQLSAKLNRKVLVFQNDRAHAVVSTGQRNTLEWRVVGATGVTWSIQVAEPANASCGGTGTLDASGKEGRFCDFNT